MPEDNEGLIERVVKLHCGDWIGHHSGCQCGEVIYHAYEPASLQGEMQEPSQAMDVALELLSDAQMLFAHGVGAMTDNGDRDNQERNIREAGELNLRISNFIAALRTAAPRPALNPHRGEKQ